MLGPSLPTTNAEEALPTEKQRREAARRHLERQLERRQERERRRRKVTFVASVVGTVVIVGVAILAIAVLGSGKDKHSAAATSTPLSGATPSSSPTPTYRAARGASVTFDGVTVSGATDTAGQPGVSVKATGVPKVLEYKDLVVGKGRGASPTSAVKAQYVGVVYKTGKIFQSSWKLGGSVPFTLGPGKVIDGFTSGIGGAKGVPAMRVGGRRIVIIPSVLAYGASPPPGSGIPANADLVFIIDLTTLT